MGSRIVFLSLSLSFFFSFFFFLNIFFSLVLEVSEYCSRTIEEVLRLYRSAGVVDVAHLPLYVLYYILICIGFPKDDKVCM